MHGLEDVCTVNVLAVLKSLHNVLKTSFQDEYMPTGIGQIYETIESSICYF